MRYKSKMKHETKRNGKGKIYVSEYLSLDKLQLRSLPLRGCVKTLLLKDSTTQISDLNKLQFVEQKCATLVLRNACFLARASRCWKRKLNGAQACSPRSVALQRR